MTGWQGTMKNVAECGRGPQKRCLLSSLKGWSPVFPSSKQMLAGWCSLLYGQERFAGVCNCRASKVQSSGSCPTPLRQLLWILLLHRLLTVLHLVSCEIWISSSCLLGVPFEYISIWKYPHISIMHPLNPNWQPFSCRYSHFWGQRRFLLQKHRENIFRMLGLAGKQTFILMLGSWDFGFENEAPSLYIIATSFD